RVHERKLLRDDRYAVRAQVATWIADGAVHGVLITGGTGFTGRDSTPEAVLPLLDKEMPGFGELFRAISFEEIGTSSLQSRAFAGLANNTFVFCLPGSTSACRTAWEKLIKAQLDARTRPCNLAGLVPRLSVFVVCVLGFGFWVLGFGFWVLGFGFWVLGFGFWVLGFG